MAFCKVFELRAPVCNAVIRIPITETRLTTPCLSMCRVAQMSFESAVCPDVPLNAIKLLIFMLRVGSYFILVGIQFFLISRNILGFYRDLVRELQLYILFKNILNYSFIVT